MKKFIKKILASTLALASTLSFSVNAEPFSRLSYRVFSVAIVGNDIVNGRPTELEPEYNKHFIDGLGKAGVRLENFEGAEVIDENHVMAGNTKFDRTSIVLNKYSTYIVRFYDLTVCDNPKEVIKDCQYAFCPYKIDTNESYEDWTARSTRLRNFVKNENEMCDLHFVGIVDGERTEEINDYFHEVGIIARNKLDIYKWRQTVDSHGIYTSDFERRCIRFMNGMMSWGGTRRCEFEECMGKEVPGVNPLREIALREIEQRQRQEEQQRRNFQINQKVTSENSPSEVAKKNQEEMNYVIPLVASIAIISLAGYLALKHKTPKRQ